MESDQFLELRRRETLEINKIVKDDFEILDSETFHTKPSVDKWSVAECLEHLNLTLNVYIPQMLSIVNDKEKYPKRSEYFKHSFIGKMAVKSMTPKANRTIPFKMKTFGSFQPHLSVGDKNKTIFKFNEFQNGILDVIDGLKDISLTKPKIITAAGPILKMRIGDALHFMVAHNQRHIQQAQNVLKIIS